MQLDDELARVGFNEKRPRAACLFGRKYAARSKGFQN